MQRNSKSKKLRNTWNIKRELDDDDDEPTTPQPVAKPAAQVPVETVVVDTMTLPAINVTITTEVTQPGVLYYVGSIQQFAMLVGPLLLRGNIGQIYNEVTTPNKTRKCRYGTSCTNPSACEYYHDPLENILSTDIRNYSAYNWYYAPGKPRCKKFGSRERIEYDILDVRDEDIALSNDMLMHDILCNLILNKYNTHIAAPRLR